MGRVDVDADGVAAERDRVGVGRHRAEALGEHAVGTAVHESDRLPVALGGHGRDRAVGRELRELDAHALGELAPTALAQQVGRARARRDVGGDRMRGSRMAVGVAQWCS